MEHTPSEIKVFVTTNYKAFNRIKGNRAINNRKIKKMVHDIKNGLNFLSDFPIVTTANNGHLDIIDGQHRFETAKQTGHPIYYIIRSGELQLNNVARINSIQEKWKPRNFLECYIERGIEDYKALSEFVNRFDLPLSVSLNLLYYGVTGGDRGAKYSLIEKFQNGEFKAKHIRQAEDIAESCRQFEKFDGWRTRPFIIAISIILSADKCEFETLVTKFNDGSELYRRGSAKEYLIQLENIYNKGESKRKSIY